MKFEIETDTLRAFAERTFNGLWVWEVTRVGVGDEQVRVIFRSGQTDERMADVISHVLGELSSVARQQAEALAKEVELDEEAAR